MRKRGEDVDLHEGKLVGLGETTRHQDAAALEVDVEDALRDERQRVAESDVGKVIGRQGRIARALRTIVRASGAHQNERVQLEIVNE